MNPSVSSSSPPFQSRPNSAAAFTSRRTVLRSTPTASSIAAQPSPLLDPLTDGDECTGRRTGAGDSNYWREGGSIGGRTGGPLSIGRPADGAGGGIVGCALALLQPDGGSQFADVLVEGGVGELAVQGGHEIGEAVRHGVQLVLGRLVGPGLAVLQEGDHQEGDDGRRGVDLH